MTPNNSTAGEPMTTGGVSECPKCGGKLETFITTHEMGKELAEPKRRLGCTDCIWMEPDLVGWAQAFQDANVVRVAWHEAAILIARLAGLPDPVLTPDPHPIPADKPSGGDLREAVARVEAATGPDHGIDRACWALFEAIPPANPLSLAYVTARDFSGSLDAALALVERVRPGWCALLAIAPDNTLCNLHTKPLGTVGVWHPLATAPTAPLALLAALLRSLVAETEAEGDGVAKLHGYLK